MRYYFIVNPTSGRGKGKRLFEKAKEILDKKGVDYSFAYTEYPFHSRELAHDAIKNGERRIICVGGDGTVNELASQIVEEKRNDPDLKIEFGILPFGTGNDLAHALSISENVEDAIDILLAGRVKKMDLGEANGKVFANFSGIGFDTDVVENTEKFKKRFSGIIPYLLGVFETLLHLKKLPVRIIADGKEIKRTCLLIAVCNGQYFGGGMKVCPLSNPDDGKLDVCIIEYVSRLQFLTMFPSFVKGKHLKYKQIEYINCEHIRIECEQERVVNYDGELDSKTPVEINILKGAIDIIC